MELNAWEIISIWFSSGNDPFTILKSRYAAIFFQHITIMRIFARKDKYQYEKNRKDSAIARFFLPLAIENVDHYAMLVYLLPTGLQ